MRPPLGVGYLFCRAADTIADTHWLLPQRRAELLERYRSLFAAAPTELDATLAALAAELAPTQENAAERELLERLPECFAALGRLGENDRDRLRTLVQTLTQGMALDLGTVSNTGEWRRRGAAVG